MTTPALGLHPARRRQLYFSEDLHDPAHPQYFITVEERTPRVFRLDFEKPDLVAVQGSVEDRTIENRATATTGTRRPRRA